MKYLLLLNFLIVISTAKVINIKNGRSESIVVSIDGNEQTLTSNQLITLSAAATISAIPVAATVDGPRSKAIINLGAITDSYSVDLQDGFNLGLKVVPIGSSNCATAVCSANLLIVCPTDKQVLNGDGAVVACQNSPLIMEKLCPLAVVDSTTSQIKSCSDASGYLVIFN